MPKSKRDKKVSLTKTNKKGLVLKQKIVEDVRNCIQKFKSVYVFTFVNMRNEIMNAVREQWKPSRFFFGKNKVIGIGFGRTEEEEVEEGLHKLAANLKGQCALLFTDSEHEEVVKWFDEYTYDEIARSGFKSTTCIELKEGPLEQFSHSMEPYLRQLGLPTKLDKGVITLLKDYEVCKNGSILTPEQAKILELLDYKLALFKLTLKACWIKGVGYQKLSTKEEDEEMSNEED